LIVESIDPLYVKQLLEQMSRAVGEADKSPPPGGVVLLGYDGSLLRRVKVTSDGKLLAQLG